MIQPQAIIAATCRHYGLTLDELRGPKRESRITWPRQQAMKIIRDNTKLTFPQIGRIFNRDHTTVIHALRRVKSKASDADLLSMTQIEARATEASERATVFMFKSRRPVQTGLTFQRHQANTQEKTT